MIGKFVKIFYDDGISVKWKTGKVVSIENDLICLDNKYWISRRRVIRVEVV